MKFTSTLLLFTLILSVFTSNVVAEEAVASGSTIYSDEKVEFSLPKGTTLLIKEKCTKEIMGRIRSSLREFRCRMVEHSNIDYLILESLSKPKYKKWQFKIIAATDKMIELGNLDAGHTVIPILSEDKSIRLLAVSIKRNTLFKKDRTVSYAQYSLSTDGFKPLNKSQPAVKDKTSNSAKTQSNSNIASPEGAPSIETIKRFVEAELKKAVPGKWIKKTIDGELNFITSIAIIKWGKAKERNGMKMFPVRIKVLGSSTVSAFNQKKTVNFNEIAEFTFIKNDFDEWTYRFSKPSVF
jgi:hypothetical protein